MNKAHQPGHTSSTPPYSLSLVIPCYNEANRLGKLFGPLETFIPQWRGNLDIVIVDDGSTDNTFDRIKTHPTFKDLEQKGRAQLIGYRTNKGKGYALKKGVVAARGDFILTLDADMSMKPTELLKWLDRKGGHLHSNEILIASRELEGSYTEGDQSRRFAGNLFNRLVRLLTPLSLKDTQCGFKLYPATIARQLFGRLRVTGWAHDVEVLGRARKKEIRITEMAIHWFQEPGSKVNVITDAFGMLGQLLRIAWTLRRST